MTSPSDREVFLNEVREAIEAVIAEAVGAYLDRREVVGCYIECDELAGAIHAALKAARITLVSPAVKAYDPHPSLTVRLAGGQVVVRGEGSGVVQTCLAGIRHTPDEARELGAALLAAAEHAETTEEA
ncbi:hypothetical protein ABVN64_30200 [Mycolicibacterium conceptionense]|uniref:hypothetical protein n=1 Tax=Mycolicibacterium conceptionense TaxID=451644 RepID=UPI00336B6562